MICWHKWTKWGRPFHAMENDAMYPTKIVVQERSCTKCNKIQVRQVESPTNEIGGILDSYEDYYGR